MNRVLSTHVCVNHRLSVAWLNKAMQAGIPAVEIFCARQHLDYRNRSQVAELGHWFGDADLKLHSIHAPMYTDEIWGRSGPHAAINICELVKGTRMTMVDEVKRALEIARLFHSSTWCSTWASAKRNLTSARSTQLSAPLKS